MEYAVDDEEIGQLRYLRRAQFRVLETYWYLRLILETPTIPDLYAKLFFTLPDRLRAMGVSLQEGVFRAQIADWRAVVDCVLIDTQYSGELFNIALSDVPERKQDLVDGRYELPAPPMGAIVAVKIIDMLGEEAIVTYQVG